MGRGTRGVAGGDGSQGLRTVIYIRRASDSWVFEYGNSSGLISDLICTTVTGVGRDLRFNAYVISGLEAEASIADDIYIGNW